MADLNKYKVFKNENFEVLTDSGFQDFKGIVIGENPNKIRLDFSDKTHLICTPKHKLIIEDGTWIYAKDVKIGLLLFGLIEVIHIDIFENNDKVYEFLHVDNGHKYFANGKLNRQCLIIDEAAFIEKNFMDEFWKSVIPVVSSGKKAKIFMVSTPNGVLNKFYDIFSEAEKGKGNWKSERIDWEEVPGRNEKWKADMISALGSEESFNQEFGNAFLDSTSGAVGVDVIERFKNNKKPPVWKSNDNTYRVYEMPDKDKIYVIGCDVGEGIGRAASTAQILDVTDLSNIRQVAVYGSNVLEPFHFANILVNICACWGNPPLLIERNNCGAQVLDALSHTLFYEKIVSYSKLTNAGGQKTTRHLGVFSHNNLRFNAVSNLRYWINFLQVVEVYDDDTISEFETFVRYPNGTYRKSSETHRDDYVMGLVWALFMLETDLCQQYFSIDEHDDQNKPLKISRNDAEYSDSELYILKDLVTGEVINECNKPIRNASKPKYIPIYGGLDSILDGRDIDIDDLSSMGYTIYRP